MPEAQQQFPLNEYTVLDLSGTVATAVCGKLFADFGARVINLENPPYGHPTRMLPPQEHTISGHESSGIHTLLSPHKESIEIDLSSITERNNLWSWIQIADVILESEQPGALDSLGIGFTELVKHSPNLLLCSISWWGQTGPFAKIPANDATIFCHISQARTVGRRDGPPILPSGYPVQIMGGLTSFNAILTHILSRKLGHSDKPIHLDVSLFESALALTDYRLAPSTEGPPLPRVGLNRHQPHFPVSIYETLDGWLGVTSLTHKQWKSFCDLIGLPKIGNHPEYNLSHNRLRDADHLDELIIPALKKRPAIDWFHDGQRMRIPLAIVPTISDLFESKQLQERKAFRQITHPDLGTRNVLALPFQFRNTNTRLDGPIARLGEHHERESETKKKTLSHNPNQSVQVRISKKPIQAHRRRTKLLQGIRIIDLTMGWAGPLTTRHLADMGAEVIKVESRQVFDWWRGFQMTPEEMATFQFEKRDVFVGMNRNKLGITLDLSNEKGIEILKKLILISDVVINNYSAGVLPKLGLSDSTLHAINPEIITVSMPPFGSIGPWKDYRAYGSTVEHMSGLPHLQGEQSDPPLTLHLALGDPIAGLNAIAALLIGILNRQNQGVGDSIDLSHMESVMALGLHGLASHLLRQNPSPRIGNRHPKYAPQGIYKCKGDEQWIMLTVESDSAWCALVKLMNDRDLAKTSLEKVDERRKSHDWIDEKISRWFATRPRDQIVEKLININVVAAPVLTELETFTHPQLQARGFWQWLNRAYVDLYPHPSAPHRIGDHPWPIDKPSPTLGEHNREVFKSLLAIDDQELDLLERDKIIGNTPIIDGK